MARSFNGSSDNIGFVDGHISGPGIAWSVSVWIRATAGANSNKDFYSEGLNSNTSPFLQWFVTAANKATLAVRADAGGSSDQLAGSAIVADGNWHHLCATQTTGNLITQYVDGVSDGTLTRTGNSSGTTTLDRASFGDFVTNGANAFAGSIAHGASWGRILLGQEVKSLANGLAASHLGPTHYWPLWGIDSPEPDIGMGTRVTTSVVVGTTKASGDPPVGRLLTI